MTSTLDSNPGTPERCRVLAAKGYQVHASNHHPSWQARRRPQVVHKGSRTACSATTARTAGAASATTRWGNLSQADIPLAASRLACPDRQVY